MMVWPRVPFAPAVLVADLDAGMACHRNLGPFTMGYLYFWGKGVLPCYSQPWM